MPVKTMKSRLYFLLLALTFATLTARSNEGPAVTIVTTPNPERLDRFAAGELKRILETLFQATVTVTNVDVEAPNRIVFGNPKTHPAIKPAGFLSRDDHFLESTPEGLVLGGTLPIATLWAVYEFGHQNGMRYLPTGDFLPLETPKFSLDGYNEHLHPLAATRTWRTFGTSPASQATWSLSDFETLFLQLVKMKFNRVELVMLPSQVFAGTVAQDSGIWDGDPIDVTGDIAGRSVFGGTKTFDHPALAKVKTPEKRRDAAVSFVKEVMGAAKKLGLAVAIEVTGANEKELATIGDLYPDADVVSPKSREPILTFAQNGKSLMPLPVVIDSDYQESGFSFETPLVADHSQNLWTLSRNAFSNGSEPKETLNDLILPICGEGVTAPFNNGLAALTEAAALIAKDDPAFGVPGNPGFMRFYESSDPVPDWIAKAKELYGKAVGEFYRANTRARDGARPLILRHAKRSTFALHYVSASEAARKAGIARAAKDEDARIENLELAIEAMHNALAIYSEVAADQSDRGAIALLNEYAYRPLLKALEE